MPIGVQTLSRMQGWSGITQALANSIGAAWGLDGNVSCPHESNAILPAGYSEVRNPFLALLVFGATRSLDARVGMALAEASSPLKAELLRVRSASV